MELNETRSWLEQNRANGLFSRYKMAACVHKDGAPLRQSNLISRISDLRCRIRPISDFRYEVMLQVCCQPWPRHTYGVDAVDGPVGTA